MSAEDEERLHSNNKCWTCNKLFVTGDNKVRGYDNTTEKYRGSARWSCNINFEFSKKMPVIFHNLKGYDSHFIMQEIGKIDVNISLIPNGPEKYMAFTINRNLAFIDTMHL